FLHIAAGNVEDLVRSVAVMDEAIIVTVAAARELACDLSVIAHDGHGDQVDAGRAARKVERAILAVGVADKAMPHARVLVGIAACNLAGVVDRGDAYVLPAVLLEECNLAVERANEAGGIILSEASSRHRSGGVDAGRDCGV